MAQYDSIQQTQALITVEGEEIEECTSFVYNADMLQIGDPFAVTVANPRGRWTSKLQKGQRIELRLSNQAVNGGQPTLKHTGRIIVPERLSGPAPAGTRIQLGCADLGWHLANCDAPLHFNLQRGTFGDLFGEMKIDGQVVPFIDRRFGLAGDFSGPGGTWRAKVLTDSAGSRALRQGIRLSKSQALATNLAGIFRRVYVVQVETGDKIADILMLYARRQNVLVNVSADGYVQVWNPDYSQQPLYRIEYHDDDSREQNNILSVRCADSLAGTFTEVTCVGEIVGLEFAQLDPNDPNAGKVVGTFIKPDLLPFPHRKTFCDGEMYEQPLAKKQAEWHYKRDLFDAFTYEVSVRGHHQDGVWWESDTMCSVDDTVSGVQGNLYVQAVRYERTSQGDITTITMKPPGLLSASFGVLPVTPRVGFSPHLGQAVSP